MRRSVVRAVAVVLAVGFAFGAVTWIALEGNEVVVIHSGGGHATRVWIADAEGAAWIEAATPERPFVRDIRADPRVEIERGGRRTPFVAEILPNPDGHARIRELLRAKYGAADTWIGLLQNTSRSLAVRLRPVSVS